MRLWFANHRSSSSQMFFEIVALKIFASFTGKHLCWSLLLIKLQPLSPATLLRRDSNTGVFLRKIWSFSENLFFYRTPLVAAFETNCLYMLWKSIGWFLYDTSFYWKGFPNSVWKDTLMKTYKIRYLNCTDIFLFCLFS